MATTNHVVIPNFPPVSSTNMFNQVWKLTRALKKAGYKYKASGNGTTKDTTADPKNDKWNGTGVGVSAGIVTNVGAAAASIATPTRGRATVTGLTGIVASDKGKFLVISGAATGANNNAHQIEEIVSATSVRISAHDAFAVASDANNGALTWEVRDPANSGETYPSATLDAVQAWWCAQGPSTIKIPITSAPVAGGGGFNFVRGENITQASSGFEGEILGWVFDSGAGYLSVAPRLRGTGAGVYGLTDGQQFSGDVSAATVTQQGTALEYRHEVVFWKNTNQTEGSIFHAIVEPVAEGATNLFSTIAAQSGCTGAVAPGGTTATPNEGTNNGFPTFAWVHWGSSNLGGAGHETWDGKNSSNPVANAQIMCADLIEEENWSADGSWVYAYNVTNIAGGAHNGFAFQRMDDCEDGDLDPYVSMAPAGGLLTLYTNSRTGAGTQSSSGSAIDECFTTAWNSNASAGTAHVIWRGWRRRGLTGDGVGGQQDFELSMLIPRQTASAVTSINITTNAGDADKVATAPAATKVREPLWITSIQSSRKMRKGTCRWMYAVQGGNGTDTYDNKKWIQLSPTNAPFIAGPWDGTSTPTAS